MIDLSLAALTRAWVTTAVASALLFLVLAAAQLCENQVYLCSLQKAAQLTAERPPADLDCGSGKNVNGTDRSHGAQAGQTSAQ